MEPGHGVKTTTATSEAGGASSKVVIVPCKYKTGRTLGQGTYATVKEAVHIDTGKYYAVKVMNKKLMRGREHLIRNEIEVLKRVSQGHRNILTLHDYFETPNNLYLVVDLAYGGELFDRICAKGSYYERDAAVIIRTTVDAVGYLHSHGIVHRDLKPENLLFRTKAEDDDLMIADFGLSRIMEEEKFHLLTTTCGTPGYMAPEVFRRVGHGKEVDLWAIGVITYFLLCGYTPFDRDAPAEEVKAILRADYSFEPREYWEGITEQAKDFIRSLLVVEPKERLTAEQALQHPFLRKVDTRGRAETMEDLSLSEKEQEEKMRKEEEEEEKKRKREEGEDVRMGEKEEGEEGQVAPNLLPKVKARFNARRALRRAVDMVRLVNHLGAHREWRCAEEDVVGKGSGDHEGPLEGQRKMGDV